MAGYAVPCALDLRAKAHHARPRTTVDSCSRALAMGLILLVVLVMLRLIATAAVHGGQTWQTSVKVKVDTGRCSNEANHERLCPSLTCSASLGPVKDMPHQSDLQQRITYACGQTAYTAFAVKGSISLSESWHSH
jgi:hypothetical protein